MASGPSHEGALPSTGFGIALQEEDQCGGSDNTHVDCTDPFRFLPCTECSPFFPYCRLYARTRIWIIRARHDNCGPKNGQSDRENFADKHDSGARRFVNERTDSGSTIY
jgi:hypothetical protein